MKTRNIYSLIVVLLGALSVMTSCSKDEDIIFDHERQQFETRADRILLEFIAPYGTAADEEIYIMGAFNGDSASMGNEQWKLMKAPNNDFKWGIYLDPSSFVNGKTLADGFRFYSATQGMEYTVKGEMANHTDNPGVGTFTNVWGERWESYYWGADGPEIEHDGYVVYVIDETGWDELTLYMWGDVNNLNGDWPGMKPTGKQTIGGVQYTYFDMGEENTNLNENLIFNNGGNGIQHPDFAYTIDHDIYLRVTASGVEELEEPDAVPHDGYAVFVVDKTGWDELALYMWGDVNDLNGGWPGMLPTGEQTIKGVTYTYFDMGEANTGLNENLIFNNNGNGTQLADFAYTIDHDVYLEITSSGVTEIDPNNYSDDGDTPEPIPSETHYIYVDNQTGWDAIALYAWGDKEFFGDWPGALPTGNKTVDGVNYTYWEFTSAGETEHLIFNNNGFGIQTPDFDVVLDRDYYLTVTAEGVTPK